MRCSNVASGFATLLAFAICVAIGGCASTKSTNTNRTGMEQLLISNAVDQSLNRVDFEPLESRTVYLDAAFLDCVDKNYIVASSRNRILQAGGKLVEKPEEAEVIVEVRSGAVGTDQSESFIGIPELSLPGPFPIAIPQVKLWSRSTQTGTAKIGLVAFDAKSREVIGRGGTTLARSDDSNTYVFGVGPYQSGTVRTEVSRQLGRPAWNPLPDAIAFAPLQSSEPAKLRLAGTEEDDSSKAPQIDQLSDRVFNDTAPATAEAPLAEPQALPTAPPAMTIEEHNPFAG